ncbi:galactose mutarotase-like [Battus philenor]|uniref:galactose mutarotase-like n=1 Tax=Battus philenor TaxID=42288 RepID=UPI0035CF6913
MVYLIEEDFGVFKGEPVKKYTWQSESGFRVSVISYGAIIQSVLVPDKNGKLSDVVFGFDDLQGYVERNNYNFGTTVGRCANRIRDASFQIDGVTYQLAKNDRVNPQNHLHGGVVGFAKVNWKTTVNGKKVICSYHSKDGEEGYPGDLVTNVVYDVTDDGAINIEYTAVTTKKTVVNLLNHSYFNLAGHETGVKELYNHVLTINADKITESDRDELPTGRFISVTDTFYDFRIPARLGDVMVKNERLIASNYCINSYSKNDLTFASRIKHPQSGRSLEVFSNQPGLQVYTATALAGPGQPGHVGKSGVEYRKYGGICLETQNYPDAVHHSNFPSPILIPGDVYKHRLVYKFAVEK